MVNKVKFSTITAVIATIAAIAAMGSIGGIGQQQIASATILDLDDIVDDDIVDDIVDDEDSDGIDSSIIIVPDITWIAPEISSRIPDDISSIAPVPDIHI